MKPIHIMRWAPADYVNDPAVKLALAQRDFVSSTFYPLFLFHSFIQSGSLPAEPVALGAVLGLRPADVRRAVAFWTEQGKLVEQDGKLMHKRVVSDVAAERTFRASQAEHSRLAYGERKATLFRHQSPPAPLPAPVPAPVPAPAPLDGAPTVAARKQYALEIWQTFCAHVGRDPEQTSSSAEFDVMARWFNAGVPLATVVRALEGCSQRGTKPRSLTYLAPMVAELDDTRRRALA